MAFDALASLREGLRKNSIRPCSRHDDLAASKSPEGALEWWETIKDCSTAAQREHLRWLGKNDLFFLLVYLLNRKHFLRDERTTKWTFRRCREVQEDPNGYADLWPRESFKSEIITFGLTIQDIINDAEKTFGFFSHTRPLASSFLMIIRRELEQNDRLKSLYDDVLWQNPKTDCLNASVPWTAHAITVKRKGNMKEATIEAWGLTDGQPTGRRFSDIVYDDVTSRDATSQTMIQATTDGLKNSFLLTASDPPRYRYIATFQEIGDTTQDVIDEGLFKLRKRGPLDSQGNVAYCSDEKFSDFRKKLGTKIFALQILLDPSKSKAETDLGFKDEWLDYYDDPPTRRAMNVYGLVDPAGDTPDSNSQFALWVVGLCADKRVRVLDIVLDKLDLEQCWQVLFNCQRKYDPLKWGYEKYGMQRDIEHYKFRMNEMNYKFNIVPLGGVRRSKDQRIGELVPWFRDKRIIFPRHLNKTLKDGRRLDVLKYFHDREYSLWPYNPKQRDLLDALARICDNDLGLVFPKPYGGVLRWGSEGYASGGGTAEGGGGGSWLSE